MLTDFDSKTTKPDDQDIRLAHSLHSFMSEDIAVDGVSRKLSCPQTLNSQLPTVKTFIDGGDGTSCRWRGIQLHL